MMFKLVPNLGLLMARVNRHYHGSIDHTWRLIKRRPLLGSSLLVVPYFWFLLLTDNEQPPLHYPENMRATLLRRLPLNTISRLMCWFAECEIPVIFRPFVYRTYASLFNCDLSEVKQSDLKCYPSVADFFTRELAPGARPIDPKAQLVSPSDGQVLHFGPVDPNYEVLEQVKGVCYSLPEFLGPPKCNAEQVANNASYSLTKTSPNKQLYQCVIYLGPGDCHRFFNPTDWTIETRRHFPGKLLSVRPSFVSRLPGVYTINERVTYLGHWAYGFMSFTAVGAVGVGSIVVSFDSSLKTNDRGDQPTRMRVRASGSSVTPYRQLELVGGLRVAKGEEFGRFRFGSTIVLIFEAPEGHVTWPIKIGQHVQAGQALLSVT